MKRIPHIKTVMTAFPYSIDIEAPIAEAQALMEEHQIRHLPVMKNGALAGVISDRDVKLTLDPELGYQPDGIVLVRHVCNHDVYVVDLNEQLDRVAADMAERHIGSALVTKDEKLVGVFTVTDACRLLAEYLRKEFFHSPGTDAA